MTDECDKILETGPLVLFDGLCNLCSFSVQFLANRDRDNKLWYASAQSASGQSVLISHHLPLDHYDSFLFVENGCLYSKSDAFLRLVLYMNSPWGLIRFLRFLPRVVRDWMYDRVARNRYALFGKRSVCMLPRAGLMARFLT